MRRKEKSKLHLVIYILFIIFYLSCGIYNFNRGSEWIIDNIIAAFFLTLFFILRKKLFLDYKSYLLICFAFLLHNLGTFGFYSFRYKDLAYDNLTHLVVCGIYTFLLIKFIQKKYNIRKDKHRAAVVLAAISIVFLFSAITEITEYYGFMSLGVGDGLLYAGAGDSDRSPDDVRGQYIDTMEDMIVNIIGAALGAVTYFFLSKKALYSKKFINKYISKPTYWL